MSSTTFSLRKQNIVPDRAGAIEDGERDNHLQAANIVASTTTHGSGAPSPRPNQGLLGPYAEIPAAHRTGLPHSTTADKLNEHLSSFNDSPVVTTQEAGKTACSGITVLIVDDEAHNLRLMEMALTRKGFQVSTAMNGEEALHKLQSLQFEVTLVDQVMPKMCGSEMIEILRKREAASPSKARTPAVMVTGNTLDKDRVQYSEAGCDGLLEKPVSIGTISDDIISFLEEYRSKGEDLSSSPISFGFIINLHKFSEASNSGQKQKEERSADPNADSRDLSISTSRGPSPHGKIGSVGSQEQYSAAISSQPIKHDFHTSIVDHERLPMTNSFERVPATSQITITGKEDYQTHESTLTQSAASSLSPRALSFDNSDSSWMGMIR